MGYSIGIRPKNKTLKEKMMRFMEKNYTLPHVLFQKFYPNYKDDYSNFTDDMSYDHGRLAIGFDYNACEPERDYIFAVCRWMALKIGKSATFKGLGSVPFYVYDGYEKCPLLVRSEWEKKVPAKYEWALVDEVGFKDFIQKFRGVPLFTNPDGTFNMKKALEHMKNEDALMEISTKKAFETIRVELVRLDKLFIQTGNPKE